MPLKVAKGNMYDWVTHTHTHLGGECPHACRYCYVDNPRFGRAPRYTGPVRLIEEEFDVKYGVGKTIFIEHMNDLFAAGVPDEFILRIMGHCHEYPANRYVFQTKNPERMAEFVTIMPEAVTLGTTIESDIWHPQMGLAPFPPQRLSGMLRVKRIIESTGRKFKLFVTIEPVMRFNPTILAYMIAQIEPDFLNLGADSKGRGLDEPTQEDVHKLVTILREAYKIELRVKRNMGRLASVNAHALAEERSEHTHQQEVRQ